MSSGTLFANRRIDRPFGNYLLCTRKLGQGLLSLRHSTRNSKVANFPNRSISKDVQHVLQSILNNDFKTASDIALNQLDYNYLTRLLRQANIEHPQLKMKLVTVPSGSLWDDDEDTIDDLSKLKIQYDILLGESRLNDNPVIKSKLKQVIDEMVQRDVIDQNTGNLFKEIYC